MLQEYHVIYSVRYYPRFHVNAVGLGTYCPWIRGHTFPLYSQTQLRFSRKTPPPYVSEKIPTTEQPSQPPRQFYFIHFKAYCINIYNCWMGPRAGMDKREKSRPHRDSIPGPSSP
jgi:hypothetical protein